MKRFKKNYLNFAYFVYRWIQPILDPIKLLSLPKYFGFIGDWIKYSRMKEAEHISLLDTYPCLYEKTKTTKFDRHYFYQDIWAFRRIYESKVVHHIDVGSRIDFVGFLSSITKVTFVDIRPLEATLENFESIKGDIQSLPFEDNSIQSLSCLHVAEHVGLGRYGDSLNPLGTKKSCQELSRVLAKGGNLYFSLPIGKPKVCFNAHRIHSSNQILQYFDGLKLVEFSGVDDKGLFRENIDIDAFEDADYTCGLFWFKKL
jgi:SAM-dependent methyltransferase